MATRDDRTQARSDIEDASLAHPAVMFALLAVLAVVFVAYLVVGLF